MLKKVSTPVEKLPETEQDLAKVTESVAPTGPKGGEMTSDGSSTCDSEGGSAVQRRERVLAKRSRTRLHRYLQEVFEGVTAELTFLEKKAVTDRVRKYYSNELEQFFAYATQNNLPLRAPTQVDAALSAYCNQCFFRGEESSRGEKLLAAVMHFFPEYGRLGGAKIPRAWRCVKGWRRLSPARSRQALPLAVWCAFAWHLCCQGHPLMAVFLLLLVSTYARPNELLRVAKGCVVAPAHNITSVWSLVLNPAEGLRPSKTGAVDESMLLDSPWLQWLGPALTILNEGDPTQPLFNFSYPQFLHHFRKARQELRLKDVVPYQARHSGPSIDRARGLRSQVEVQKRGRWQAAKSMARYERAAKLARTWQELSASQRQLFTECEKYIEEIVLGRPYPEQQLPR